LIKSKENITINGVDLAEHLTDANDFYYDYFIVNSVSGRGIIGEENEIISVEKMDGAHASYSRTPVRYLVVTITAKGKDENSLHKKIERLDDLMPRGKDLVITFADEVDREYYGRLSDVQGEFLSNIIYRAVLTFICPDPYKYGQEKELNFTDDSIIIDNKGTATAKPIFELTAKKKSTFAMISNGDEQYNLIGQPADDDVQVVDSRTSVLYENGSTIGDWQVATSQMIDETRMPKIDGAMGTDGAGIRASSYGTGNNLHGPAVFKEINPIQDFEIETTFDINSRREIESWRMGINFLDENLNMLGHIGIKDNNRNYKRRVPLARYGPYRGGGVENGNLIGDRDKVDDARDLTLFYLRAKREGKKFSFFIGEWKSQRYVREWSANYIDVNNEYGGKLKYITLYIAKYADRPSPSRLRINSVEVFELATVQQDQTPYIIYPGDVVTFDHVNDDVLLNGELSKDTFFGDFFELNKGVNTLTVSPSDTFDAQVKFRERWR